MWSVSFLHLIVPFIIAFILSMRGRINCACVIDIPRTCPRGCE